MIREIKNLTNKEIMILLEQIGTEIKLRGGGINMGIEINKRVEKEVETCKHDYIVVEKFETSDGFGYAFFCKYCLDLQLKELKFQKEENKDGN